MNTEMMAVIESQAKTNKLLVEALRQSHDDLEDMKDHIANIKDEGSECAMSCSQTDLTPTLCPGHTPSVKSVSGPDTQPEVASLDNNHVAYREWGSGPGGFSEDYVPTPTIPENYCPYPDITVSEMFRHLLGFVESLPENNAVFADRKLRMRWLANTVRKFYTTNLKIVQEVEVERNQLKEGLKVAERDVEDAKGHVNYEKSQSAYFRKSWIELSEACRAFTTDLDESLLSGEWQAKLDDMLSKCTTAR